MRVFCFPADRKRAFLLVAVLLLTGSAGTKTGTATTAPPGTASPSAATGFTVSAY